MHKATRQLDDADGTAFIWCEVTVFILGHLFGDVVNLQNSKPSYLNL